MSKWDFQALERNAHGHRYLVELSAKQKESVDWYVEALETARQSIVAKPTFSDYFVKGSAGLVTGAMVPAGNIEYGFCQALHGEEAAVSAFRSHFGRDCAKGTVIGMVAGSPGNVATPCGNCRDILLEDFGKDFEIVSGAAEGGLAIVAKMSLYLHDDFHQKEPAADWPEVLEKASIALRQGALLVNDAYSPPNVYPERKYFALIATRDHEYVGAHDVMCDYHPIYALRDAIRQARRANDPFVQSVVIVGQNCDGNMPHVMYKDRQHLMELCLQSELLTESECNPPIYLMSRQGKRQATNAWRTNVKEWLPFPFTPRNFGPEFVAHLTEYYRSLGRQ